MAMHRVRRFMPAAAVLADAANSLRFCAFALAFCATAASAQLSDIRPVSPVLPNAFLNKFYSVTFTTIPGNTGFPIFWFTGEAGCFDGSGLTFSQSNNTATIQGVPAQLGTYSCQITAQVSDPSSITKTYTLHVIKPCQPPQITSGDPPAAIAGVPYSFTVTATGKPPLTFTAMGLPAGLTIDAASGIIAGTTNATGTHAVSISVTGCGRSALQDLTLVVNPPPPAMVALSLANQPNPAIFGQPVTVVAHAVDGTVVPIGDVLLCVVAPGQFCAPPVGAPPTGTDPSLIPPLLSAPLDANGNATFTLNGLLIENYLLSAYYAGDAAHLPATAGPVDQFVIKGFLLPPAHAANRPSRAAQAQLPAQATPIPTLSWTALALLALVIAGVVAVRLRRRPRGG
jgi:hypothetical protein